jgi:hypothetical protein
MVSAADAPMPAEPCIVPPTKYWEIIADKLRANDWTWSYCNAVTETSSRWVVDAYRCDEQRYIVHRWCGAPRCIACNARRRRPQIRQLLREGIR